jgi:hypothetical protein
VQAVPWTQLWAWVSTDSARAVAARDLASELAVKARHFRVDGKSLANLVRRVWPTAWPAVAARLGTDAVPPIERRRLRGTERASFKKIRLLQIADRRK